MLHCAGMQAGKRVAADWRTILGEAAIDIRAGKLSANLQGQLKGWPARGGGGRFKRAAGVCAFDPHHLTTHPHACSVPVGRGGGVRAPRVRREQPDGPGGVPEAARVPPRRRRALPGPRRQAPRCALRLGAAGGLVLLLGTTRARTAIGAHAACCQPLSLVAPAPPQPHTHPCVVPQAARTICWWRRTPSPWPCTAPTCCAGRRAWTTSPWRCAWRTWAGPPCGGWWSAWTRAGSCSSATWAPTP